MRNLSLVLIAVLALAMLPVAAIADPGPYDPTMTGDGYDSTPDLIPTPNETGQTPDIHDAINLLLGTNIYTSNEMVDSFQVVNPHSYWYDLGGGGQSSAFMAIGLSAAATNSLGVYLPGSGVPGSIQNVISLSPGNGFLGAGTLANPFPGGINPYTTQNFGFALTSTYGASVNHWYSDPSLNPDGIDHMLAYDLSALAGQQYYVDLGSGPVLITLSSDTYLLTFEDLNLNDPMFDSDYNDTMFLVTRVAPIPEPVSMLLLGSGLLGLVGLRRKLS